MSSPIADGMDATRIYLVFGALLVLLLVIAVRSGS